MTKKAKVTGIKFTTKKQSQNQQSTPSVTQIMSGINEKFTHLKKLRTQIHTLKTLYAEHDALITELLPLFIETEADKFIIKREISIGSKKYRFNPFFYDEKKAQVVVKVWKSTAFESGSIE